MTERADGHANDAANLVSDREAGRLLLAFLAAVILVLAAATLPFGPTLPESGGEAVVTHDSESGEMQRTEPRLNR